MTSPLYGQMMDVPLLASSLLSHAARHFGDTEIVSRRIEGDIHRYTYRDCAEAREAARAGADRARRRTAATASPRSRGTATGISSATTASSGIGRRAATRSTRGFFPTRSPSSSTTPTTRTLFFDMTFAAARRACIAPQCPTVQALDRAGRRAHMPRALGYPPNAAELRDAGRRAGRRLRLAAVRRAHGVVALLHVRHDRQSEGRALLASLDGAACLRRGAARCDGPLRAATRSCPSCRCSM